ncbi:MAG: hypothetical protein RBR75_03135 [Acholeplasmataceae bacterium]|nr:hypothetical protein [Acholeplasmataceae bacterium]
MNRKMKQKEIKRFLYISIFHFIMVIMILFSVALIKAKKEKSVLNLFGYGLYVESYETSLNYRQNIILLKMLKSYDKENIEAGERVIYYDFGELDVVIQEVEEVNQTSPPTLYTMKLSEEASMDHFVQSHEILAKETGSIKYLGWILKIIQTPLGFFFIIVLPVLIYLIYEIIHLVIYASHYHIHKVERDCIRKAKQKVKEVEEVFSKAKKWLQKT